jgi:hypothetical protein
MISKGMIWESASHGSCHHDHEVAEHIRINKKNAYRLAADSKLSGFKVGGTLAVSARGYRGLDRA